MPKYFVVTDVYPNLEKKPMMGVTGKTDSDTAEQYGHRCKIYVEGKN